RRDWIWLFMTVGVVADAPTERIAFIKQQGGFGIYKGGASNGRRDFSGGAVEPTKTAGERAAEDAFLNPGLAFFEFFVRGEAGKFGAGARAAGRTIVSLARALDEVA